MTYAGPISARVFMLLISIFHFAIYLFKKSLEEKQQKKPLPPEVADIYDSERYCLTRSGT